MDPSETLNQQKASWAQSVLDEDKGIYPALTLIKNLAAGTVPLTGSKVGLIETFFDKVSENQWDKKGMSAYVNVYHHCRDYLGQLFMIQFMGTVMLVNAYLSKGEKGPASTVAKALTAKIKAQTEMMSKLTPDLLKFLGALPSKEHSIVARFRNHAAEKVAYTTDNKESDLSILLHHKKGDEKELWHIGSADDSKSDFYIWSSRRCTGSKIQGGGSQNDPVAALAWWGNESAHKWHFLPSQRHKGYFLIMKRDGEIWQLGTEGINQFIRLTKEDNGDLVDENDTQWKLEFANKVPIVFP